MSKGGRRIAVAWVVFGTLVAAGAALAAQDLSAQFEKTVDFKLQQTIELGAKIGPAKVAFVEFSNLGRGYGQGGLGGRLRGTGSEVSTVLRSRLGVDNPGEEWELAVTLEFEDKDGKTIERFTTKAKFEGEAKPWNIEHPILEYVVPLIAKVKIHIEGRED
ncbi:MAG: hypothetical protein U0Q12_12090 [Vicinamibacterales bacterium]